MKIGELFINIIAKGDTKKLDQAIDKMEEAEKRTKRLIKYKKDLAKATSEDEKKLIKENFAQQVKLDKMKAQSTAIKKQNAQWLGMAKSVGAYIGSITLAYKAVDILITSLSRANQQMITFQRTTGISFSSLNKYASANAAVNFNSSIEGTAQSMQRVANNLWDIQMGRGDISPYQELAFVGGKAFNPYGMSVEQVIENVRDAIKGVDDLQATNIIQRMGFAPDDLMMLRMSRQEFEKINNLFLDPKDREAINKYSLEIKKIQLQFNLLKDKTLLKIMPYFIKLTQHLNTVADGLMRIVNWAAKTPVVSSAIKGIATALGVLFLALNPVVAKFALLYLTLEDIAYWMTGKGSLLGDLIGNKGEVREKHPTMNTLGTGWETLNSIWDIYKKVRSGEITGEEANQMASERLREIIQKHDLINAKHFNKTSNVNQNNSIVINSNQPTAAMVKDYTNMFVFPQGQLLSLAQ